MDDAIVLEDVSHRYGQVWALREVSLTLPAGKTIGLIGPDGVGKSTLLSLIAGVKRLQTGRIRVLGGDIARPAFRNELAGRLAFMPQGLGRNLYPTLSVYENVDFFARLYGLDALARKRRIERLLHATALAPFPDRPAGKLSGGMKQKLSLCCALVHNPELLILDEPTTGVDPLSRRQFWALVDTLRGELPGMTVVVATAYMEEAQRFDHLVAMDAGNVLVCDATAAVMQRAQAQTLEQAYISFLPPQRRGEQKPLDITPFEPQPGLPPSRRWI
ncbi:ABC transporter family protein [Bordetella holmesii 70147]|nr:ABC transporter family protein [Bordetella holmesii 70147]